MTHTLTDICVFIDATQSGLSALKFASELAHRHHAHLIGICTAEQESRLSSDDFARGSGIAAVIKKRSAISYARLEEIKKRLDEVSILNGHSCELRVVNNMSAREVICDAVYGDLLVVSHPISSDAPLAWLLEKIPQEAGVALLAIPNTWVDSIIPRKVTIAWNGSRQARRAVADALPILITADDVDIITVGHGHIFNEIDVPPAAGVADYLRRHGVCVTTHHISSKNNSIARCIIDRCKSGKSDLIVFGAHEKVSISDLFLNNVAKSLIKEAAIPLLTSF